MANEELREIQDAYQKIREIKDYIQDRQGKMPTGPVPKTIRRQLELLKSNLKIFQELNQKIRESQGIEEKDVLKNYNLGITGRDPALEALMKQGDQLKCDLLIGQAQFMREQAEKVQASNRPFQEQGESKALSQGRKKKVKKKFKSMNQNNKWKRI